MAHGKGPLAVFVPVYNEHEKIGEVLEHVRRAGGGRIARLVVADDGSTDGSDKVAARIADDIVRLPKNSGNGACTRAALRHLAGLDVAWGAVIRIDGDGQHEPDLLPEVIGRLDRGADVVVCSRFHPQSERGHAMLDRACLNSAMAHMMAGVTGWPVTDARSGFLGFDWDILSRVVPDLRTERYGIPMELLLRVWHAEPRARFEEIPHPAKYELGISRRLDAKYASESLADKVGRMTEAYRVFLATCADLGLDGRPNAHEATR